MKEENEKKEKKTLKEKLQLSDKGKKRLKIIVGIILLIFVVIFVNVNSYKDFKEISKNVNKDYKELETIANAYLNGDDPDFPDYVEKVRVYKDKNTVEFSTNGEGLVSTATYYGFYYSKNDKPVSFQNEYDLIQIGEDKWMWSAKGDNDGKTFKIRNNWYYYEASF